MATRGRRAFRRLWREDKGATAIITGVVISVLMGFTALAVEVGLWYGDRRASQTAADAAALGAGYEIYEVGSDSTDITAAGEADADRNGYTNGADGVVLTVNSPPLAGPDAGNEYAAEVILEKPRATLRSSLFLGGGEVSIKTRAVAVVRPSGPFCVLALDLSGAESLKFGGTTDLTLESCGFIVNSDSPAAMSLIGGAYVEASYADIYGGYTESANSDLYLDDPDYGGAPHTGVDPLPDPFEHLDIPAGSGCDFNNFQTDNNNNAWGGAPEPLTPGRYCNGLKVRNIAHMAPGNYVIVGGTFRVVSGATLTTDPGVTIFLTGSAGDYAQVDIAGGSTVNIIAPTTGTYQGIAVFQDRDAPPASDVSANTFNGGSSMEIKGAIYIPNQKTLFNGGNAAAGGCTRIVAFRIEFTGNSDIDSDCTGFGFDDETRWPPNLTE